MLIARNARFWAHMNYELTFENLSQPKKGNLLLSRSMNGERKTLADCFGHKSEMEKVKER